MALWGGWSAKAEYLYVDLGSLSNTLNVPEAGGTLTVVTSSTIRDHIFRVGANYRFGSAPVVSSAY